MSMIPAVRAWPAAPQQIAVETTGREPVTYGQLSQAVAAIGERLRASGLGPGSRLGLCVSSSVAGLATMYAALDSGMVCVPLDAEMPLSRRAALLDSCELDVVIADSALAAPLTTALQRATRIVEFPDPHDLSAAVEALPGQTSTSVPRHHPARDEVALILFTSGSTGSPKGVSLSHAALAAALDWYGKACEATAEDCFASHAPLQFSVSLFNALLPARIGARVLLPEPSVRRSPRALAAALRDHRVSIWMCAPSVLRLLLRHGAIRPGPGALPDLLLVGGEVCPPALVQAVRQLSPESRLIGLYASTESNGCTLYSPSTEAIDAQGNAIGRACFDVQLRIVDNNGDDVEDGPGEIWVSGPALASGYWNDAPLSQRTFVHEAGGRRWFRSGDVGLRTADGELRYLGRTDRRVKRRGYRVSLEEIEACLYRHPDIAEAAVLALPDELSGVRLLAVLSCRAEVPPSVVDLRLFCAERLPSYMLPDRFELLPELPKRANGKIDLQRLGEAAW